MEDDEHNDQKQKAADRWGIENGLRQVSKSPQAWDRFVEEFLAVRQAAEDAQNPRYDQFRALGYTPSLPDGWTLGDVEAVERELRDIQQPEEARGHIREFFGFRERYYQDLLAGHPHPQMDDLLLQQIRDAMRQMGLKQLRINIHKGYRRDPYEALLIQPDMVPPHWMYQHQANRGGRNKAHEVLGIPQDQKHQFKAPYQRTMDGDAAGENALLMDWPLAHNMAAGQRRWPGAAVSLPQLEPQPPQNQAPGYRPIDGCSMGSRERPRLDNGTGGLSQKPGVGVPLPQLRPQPEHLQVQNPAAVPNTDQGGIPSADQPKEHKDKDKHKKSTLLAPTDETLGCPQCNVKYPGNDIQGYPNHVESCVESQVVRRNPLEHNSHWPQPLDLHRRPLRRDSPPVSPKNKGEDQTPLLNQSNNLTLGRKNSQGEVEERASKKTWNFFGKDKHPFNKLGYGTSTKESFDFKLAKKEPLSPDQEVFPLYQNGGSMPQYDGGMEEPKRKKSVFQKLKSKVSRKDRKGNGNIADEHGDSDVDVDGLDFPDDEDPDYMSHGHRLGESRSRAGNGAGGNQRQPISYTSKADAKHGHDLEQPKRKKSMFGRLREFSSKKIHDSMKDDRDGPDEWDDGPGEYYNYRGTPLVSPMPPPTTSAKAGGKKEKAYVRAPLPPRKYSPPPKMDEQYDPWDDDDSDDGYMSYGRRSAASGSIKKAGSVRSSIASGSVRGSVRVSARGSGRNSVASGSTRGSIASASRTSIASCSAMSQSSKTEGQKKKENLPIWRGKDTLSDMKRGGGRGGRRGGGRGGGAGSSFVTGGSSASDFGPVFRDAFGGK